MVHIAVVIPTRNRGGQAAEAARAVLRDTTAFELVVVDQSDDDTTREALRELESDTRLRVVRSELRGASNARNVGVSETTAPILAFTDDDCRPGSSWVSSVLRVFDAEPGADLVFGRVRLPPLAHELDYAASFEPKARVQRAVPLPDGDIGIGANFAIRRDVLARLGGFDPLLGPGAPYFRGAEETDLLIRALHEGYRVINAEECDVLHLGVRTGADVRPLHVAYQFAVGAAFGKYARLTGLSGIRDAGRWVDFYARMTLSDTLRLRRPRPGVLFYFVAGAVLTFRYRVDRTRKVFRQRFR
jgi:glycosyltransferase involved in cell wall biosynthesis